MVPNLRMRDDLEEMCEMNWLEYVRRDTEGSDNDTRRRAACELVRGLTDKFPAEVRASRASVSLRCAFLKKILSGFT